MLRPCREDDGKQKIIDSLDSSGRQTYLENLGNYVKVGIKHAGCSLNTEQTIGKLEVGQRQ